MPRGRLKFGGRWTLEDSGRDCAIEITRTHTRFTQVRGPREEVKPLLLLLVLIYVVTNRVTEVVLELYQMNYELAKAKGEKSLSVVLPVGRVPVRAPPGAPHIGSPGDKKHCTRVIICTLVTSASL